MNCEWKFELKKNEKFSREEKSRERFRRSKSLCELPTPHRLKWNLNHFLKQNISLAKENLHK